MKKLIISLFVCLAAVILLPNVGGELSASALTEGNYTYTVSNKKTTITDFSESYSGELVIPDTLGGYPVTSIGENAFKNCSGLTNVTVPNSVTYIGVGAFRDCDSIKSITLPFVGSTTSAEDEPEGVFGCIFGYSVYEENGGVRQVYDIWADDTECCIYAKIPSSLSNVTITNDKNIPQYAFWNIDLHSLTLPDCITEIGASAFEYSNISVVNIPDLSTWCEIDFFNDYSVPGGRLYVNGSAVSSDLIIPEGTERISAYAFYSKNWIESVSIPGSVEYIGYLSFGACKKLKKIEILHGVTEINNSAFAYCGSLTSITIPNSVTSIGDSAFSYCSSLTSITIPNSVKRIGEAAFAGCTSLKNISLPFVGRKVYDYNHEENQSFGYIFGSYSFANSTKIKQYGSSTSDSQSWYIPNSLKTVSVTGKSSLAYGAFYNCSMLTKISLSDDVVIRGDKVFYNTVYSNKDKWNNGVLYIDNHLIEADDSIRSCTIKEGTKSIAFGAFVGCDLITSITIPESVTYLDDAFECNALRTVNFNAAKVADLSSQGGFFRCSNLTTINFGDSVEVIPANLCDGCDNITTVTFGRNIKSIRTAAFWNCARLKEIILPSSLTHIGRAAFKYCDSLTKAVLGGAETIEEEAFYGCRRLVQLVVPKTLTSVGESAFYNCPLSSKIYYLGNENEWYNIVICLKNDKFLHAKITYHICNNVSTTTIKKPTCTEQGESEQKCITCGYIQTTYINATGHTYSNKCDTTCNICRETRTVGPHSYKEATCTQNRTCSECGDQIWNTWLPHKYSNPTCEKNATCEVCGHEDWGTQLDHEPSKRNCEFCEKCGGYSGFWHSYSEYSCTKGIVCTLCGDVAEPGSGHSYITRTTKATHKKDGKIVTKCRDCGYTKSTKIYAAKTVILSKTTFIYNGKIQKPTVIIKDSNGKILSKKYYTVKFLTVHGSATRSKDIGRYKVKVKFKGNYTGSEYIYYNINPKKALNLKLKAGKKQLTVSWKKDTSVTGYEIQYSTSKKFTKSTTKTTTVKEAKTTSATIKKLKAKKTYYVRIRTYKVVKGKKYYSAWSKALKKKTK